MTDTDAGCAQAMRRRLGLGLGLGLTKRQLQAGHEPVMSTRYALGTAVMRTAVQSGPDCSARLLVLCAQELPACLLHHLFLTCYRVTL